MRCADSRFRYLKSPIIELVVGEGEEQAVLSAHQALLTLSPFLSSAIAESSVCSPYLACPFPLTFSVLKQNRRVQLPYDDLDAVSSFLEYLYTGEYFPHKTASGTLQPDPTQPAIDESGAQLLKHAKVYTLAEKLGVSALKTLSHSKIHLITSTAIAEIAYARYVYTNTSRSDLTIRKPVASFWGQRSHVLRHETEGSFKAMCLEYPEFAFDVLSFVLDVEEKREKRREGEEVGRSARKRRVGER